MAQKRLKTRLIQKHDIEANWNTAHEKGFTPLEGEIIVYDAETVSDDLPSGRTSRITYERFKIGDGKTAVGALPFAAYSKAEMDSLLSGKAPTSHASSSTTYGVATTGNYGHVKISNGDVNTVTSANGLAAGMDHTHGNYVDKVSGKGLSTNDLTSTLKNNYDAAYTHSQSAHAPSNAEKNIIIGIQKNGTDLTVDSSTRKVNITVPTVDSALSSTSTNPVQNKVVNTALGNKVDKVSGKGLSTNDYTTSEKDKLSGIAAGAEVNVQSDWDVTDTTSDAYIKNKPTIPTVNNGTLTIKRNGTTVATFTANQSGNTTADITDKDTTYSTFVKSGSGAAAGLVPKPSTTAGTSKYLREDGTWQTPPNTDTKVSFTSTTSNYEYPLLFKYSTGSTTTANSARFNTDITANPSTGTLTATKFIGDLGDSDAPTDIYANHIEVVAGVDTDFIQADGAQFDGGVDCADYIATDAYIEAGDYINVGSGNEIGNLDESNCGTQNKGRMVVGNENDYSGENGACIGYGLKGRGAQLICGFNNLIFQGVGEEGGCIVGHQNSNVIFSVGNGTSNTTSGVSNAFHVNANGNCYVGKTLSQNSADYAEWFEWEDGNPNAESRRGRFVTLVGEKVRIATNEDDYLLGVVSVSPGVVGDTHEDEWAGKYATDVYGDRIYETVITPDTTRDDGTFVPGGIAEQWKVSQHYDPSQLYIPRSQRREWVTIGLLGKIVIDDDGTCVVGKRCKPNANGIATLSNDNTGYYVMSRIDENHIKVFVK